ncbi:hypothetical protein, partial [Stomatohabitans albus]|uniref:hypothetical protein n=1 Tax=Stomatohabitans albus TaxID=3110766 RepID=UPI00300C3748
IPRRSTIGAAIVIAIVAIQAAMVPAVLAAAWLTRAFVTPSGRPRTTSGQDLIPDPAQDMVDHG